MEVRPISDHLLKTATTKLNEEPNRIRDDIDHIKGWLKKQPHLIARQNDQWILNFLRGCKFSLEKTKRKLDAYYTFRKIAPDLFQNRDSFSPVSQELLKQRIGCILPIEENIPGPIVFMSKAGIEFAEFVKAHDMIKMGYLTMDILLNESDRAVIEGVSSLIDVEGFKWSQAVEYTPALIQKATKIFMDGYPMRTHSVHFVNTPPNFTPIFNMVKRFTHPKVRNRLYIHENVETLSKYIPKSSLPTEYGGTAGSYNDIADNWRAKVESYSDWLKDDEKYCTNENLRPGKPKTSEELLNSTGSFRQLNVD